jgi:hypothetical protein
MEQSGVQVDKSVIVAAATNMRDLIAKTHPNALIVMANTCHPQKNARYGSVNPKLSS